MPYSYDHFGFSLSASRVRFSFYTTRLNDMNAINVQGDSVYTDARRYFLIQRGDLRLSDNLNIGLAQAATYGGPERTMEAWYLNPLGLAYIMQRNNGAQMSGFWALDLWWKPVQKLTLYGQYLIDDIIVNNEPGQDDRAVHPDRFGVIARAVLSDAGFGGWQLGLSYARVWNWTYLSYRSWENYVSYNKSLGYPHNAVEVIKLDVDVFRRPPFIFHAQSGYQRHGDQGLLQPFGDSKENFPIGTVEYRGWAELAVDWLYAPWLSAGAGVRYESIQNELNVPGRQRDQLLFRVQVGVNGGWD